MALWRVLKLLAIAVTGVYAHAQQQDNSNSNSSVIASAGVVRRLGGAVGNVAACYAPFHNPDYPLNGGGADVNRLRAAIDDDFRLMSQHFTHVRTYYSMHFGIEIAPIAAKYGIKLWLGVFMTTDSWGNDEMNAAVNAIKKYSGTVEVVLVGNENLINFHQRSWDILNKVNDLKNRAGGDAWRVKYGTVQRVNEFLDARFEWDMQQLKNGLDILGVNIYPFFDNGYNSARPTDLLDMLWNKVVTKYPREKIRLTETGFPTGGAPSSISPRVMPALNSALGYYEALVNWVPSGCENCPKFWFQAFDRRWGDPAAYVDLERFFGFFTTDKRAKCDGYPRKIGSAPVVVQDGAGTVSAPSVPSAPGSSSCPIDEGQDYQGSDVGNAPSNSAEGCFAICNSRPACGAFSWTSYNFGTCWLKSSKGASWGKPGVRSGVKCTPPDASSPATAPSTPAAAASCVIDEGKDYQGGDVGNAQSNNAEGCFAICNSRSACGAFTWSSYAGGTCWLKSSKGNSFAKSGVRSGVKCTSSSTPAASGGKCDLDGLERGLDYAGNDMGNAASGNAEGCVAACQKRSGCKAFTWSGYAGGTCWLKTAKGATSSKGDVTSGVIC